MRRIKLLVKYLLRNRAFLMALLALALIALSPVLADDGNDPKDDPIFDPWPMGRSP